MLFSSPLKTILLLGAIASQVSAHVIFTVDAKSDAAAVRNDVTKAGSCNVAGALAGSTVTADATGAFTALAKSFNGGSDGATTIKTAVFDANADGKAFVGKVTIVSGGVANPKGAETDDVKLSLPAGTVCKGPGGACLVQLSSSGGFGNCVSVIPAGGSVAAVAAVTTAAAAAASTATAVAAAAASTASAAAACEPRHRHRGACINRNKATTTTTNAAKTKKVKTAAGRSVAEVVRRAWVGRMLGAATA